MLLYPGSEKEAKTAENKSGQSSWVTRRAGRLVLARSDPVQFVGVYRYNPDIPELLVMVSQHKRGAGRGRGPDSERWTWRARGGEAGCREPKTEKPKTEKPETEKPETGKPETEKPDDRQRDRQRGTRRRPQDPDEIQHETQNQTTEDRVLQADRATELKTQIIHPPHPTNKHQLFYHSRRRR